MICSKFPYAVAILCVIPFSVPCHAQERDDAVEVVVADAPSSEPTASFFTLGTLAGAAIRLYDPTEYRINGAGVVVEDDDASRVGPATFILPSIAIAKVFTRQLSAILPLGFAGDFEDVSFGLGLSLALNSPNARAEIGIAPAIVWSPFNDLNRAQERSLREGTPLGADEQGAIGNDLRPSLVIGFYIAPKL
jgi:hypothetical protein